MATMGDFPSNCSTNTYVLQDFGELAYIVCAVSIPPSSNHTVQASSPESNLARLKLTESQFRQASILAIIDSDTSQLFTFYKKMDVLKDQKTLLHKFGHILRSNSCTIAYKAAARMPELFKPEHAKLYRLFVSAILASIQVIPHDDRKIMRLGQRYCVIEHASGESANPVSSSDWSLVRTDLQILQTGHVTLTVVVNNSFSLFLLSTGTSQLPKVTGVVLAPGGQIAFFRNETEAASNSALPFDSTTLTGNCRSIWQARITAWLKSTGNVNVLGEVTSWIELMLPVFEQRIEEIADDSSPKISTDPERRLIFKPILWPAHLCFARRELSIDNAEVTGDEDPLQFVLEWMQTTAEREAEFQQQASEVAKDDEGALFADEGPFDNMETFQSFGPPLFPASQTVYPTPPDVVMTHATPAMSSVDGLVTTPATMYRGPGDIHRARQDVEMTGVDPAQATGVGSGFYEEDLFEEVPEGTFDQEGGGNEPNWDFFDKPDMDEAQPQVERSASDSKSSKTSLRRTSSGQSKPENPAPQPQLPESEVPTEMLFQPQSFPATVERQSSRSAPEPTGERQPQPMSVSELNDVPQERADSNHTTRRRGSSIYDVIDPDQHRSNHDGKYSQKGEFWFDANAKPKPPDRVQSLENWRFRPASTQSESDSESDSSDDGHDWTLAGPNSAKPVTIPGWHEYQPAFTTEENGDHKIDTSSLDTEIRATLNLLRMKSSGPLLEDLFMRKRNSVARAGLSAELRLMLAQIFVDQYTQASLLHGGNSAEDEHTTISEKDVSIDLSQMNSTVGCATVSQLTDITPPIAGRQPTGKTVRLSENIIAIKRSDKAMLATPAIISFWDTLALQSYSRPKDITAFCLHTPGAGYADGCAHFLGRIADAYGSCGLGNHKSGNLQGLTNNGVIAMAPEPMTVARRFAETLTSNIELTGTAVVYMIGKAADARSYIGCCRYFLGLFTYYKNFATSRGKPLELVLQIIPASFLVSNDTLIVPAQRSYNDLAFEIYSRIPPDSAAETGTCDYPLTLADTSGSVKFSLESRAVSPAPKDGKVLHLAYSFTDDQRWLIACWTDKLGYKALIMTYQLKFRNESRGRPREEIMKEIWEVSHDLMRKQRNKWRLVVARTGFYEAVELNAWMHLANAESKSQTCELVLLSVENRPGLRLLDPTVQAKAAQPPNVSQQPIYGTPASTPQAISTTSPETLVPATPTPGGTSAPNAPTPPEHSFDTSIDGDLSLTDPIEESWAVVLPFGTNQSHNMLDIRPALTSGYLVKRLGTKDEEGTTMLGVHLVHAPAQSSPGIPGQREELLEEILEQYRGLATLAMARGCIDKTRTVVPWHIHTSLTGSDVLGTLL